jgi:hypothetical protein
MKNEMKVTVSAIAIGAEADVRVMKRISQYGGGLFHQTIDPTSLPQIVLAQLQDNPSEEPRGERELTPIQERGSELLAGFAVRSYPKLFGYMETELKRGAHLDLMLRKTENTMWRLGVRRKNAVFGRPEAVGPELDPMECSQTFGKGSRLFAQRRA